ncbi:MAG: hypothetical protein MR817_12425 [Lachnospiraceae bacterium]|nr:hypothetical protein [Lachnospiraceae bacterium]
MKNLQYICIAAVCLVLIGCGRETVNSDINSDINSDVNSTVEVAKDTDIADEIALSDEAIHWICGGRTK